VIRLHHAARDDLLGGEVLQVDHGHARAGLVADEEVLAVVVARGLGQRGVVGVRPGLGLAVAIAAGEHGLGLIVEAVALPGLGGEHGDVLEDAHRR